MLAKKPKGAVEKRPSSGFSSLLWIFVGSVLTVMIGLALYWVNPFDIGTEEKVEEHTVKPLNQTTNKADDYEFYDLLPGQEMISVPDEAVVDESDLSTGDTELRPDVVVTDPSAQSGDNATTTNQNPGNDGISEDPITNPMGSQPPSTTNDDQDIVIIEEEGTYDEPAENDTSGQSAPSASQGNATNQASTGFKTAVPKKSSYIIQIHSYNTAEEADKRRAQVLLAGVDVRVIKNKRANGQVIYQVVSSPMINRQAVLAAQQKLQNNGIDSLIVEQRR